MTVVVAEVALVIVAVPDADESSVHVPAPVPAIVAEPPGRDIQVSVWSTPADGPVLTVTVAVSEQPAALVHLNEYTPAAE